MSRCGVLVHGHQTRQQMLSFFFFFCGVDAAISSLISCPKHLRRALFRHADSLKHRHAGRRDQTRAGAAGQVHLLQPAPGMGPWVMAGRPRPDPDGLFAAGLARASPINGPKFGGPKPKMQNLDRQKVRFGASKKAQLQQMVQIDGPKEQLQ